MVIHITITCIGRIAALLRCWGSYLKVHRRQQSIEYPRDSWSRKLRPGVSGESQIGLAPSCRLENLVFTHSHVTYLRIASLEG
jgi:hypothetical protein